MAALHPRFHSNDVQFAIVPLVKSMRIEISVRTCYKKQDAVMGVYRLEIMVVRFDSTRVDGQMFKEGLRTFKRFYIISRWWFQIFFIFIPSWGHDPILTNIFFKGVETTN